jgi:hypothetical protein
MKVNYPVPSVVSVWVGTFLSESDMDQCTDNEIEPSLRLGIPLSSICEVSFEKTPCAVRDLLHGFSGWGSFIDSACEAADLLGIPTANGALVCYYLKCDASSDTWKGMRFLGSFPGADV